MISKSHFINGIKNCFCDNEELEKEKQRLIKLLLKENYDTKKE